MKRLAMVFLVVMAMGILASVAAAERPPIVIDRAMGAR